MLPTFRVTSGSDEGEDAAACSPCFVQQDGRDCPNRNMSSLSFNHSSRNKQLVRGQHHATLDAGCMVGRGGNRLKFDTEKCKRGRNVTDSQTARMLPGCHLKVREFSTSTLALG